MPSDNRRRTSLAPLSNERLVRLTLTELGLLRNALLRAADWSNDPDFIKGCEDPGAEKRTIAAFYALERKIRRHAQR